MSANELMTNFDSRKDYFRIVWQSALAGGLCLGLPAGLLLWLILFREISHSAVIELLINILN